jgi:hypothetical protein
MTGRPLAVIWVLIAIIFLAVLLVEVSKWRSVSLEAARAGAERLRLTAEIQLKEQQLATEMRKQSGLVQEMRWAEMGTDPSLFVTRVADLARDKRMTISSIGPLERLSSPQFTKSWHSIQVRGPYREMRELAARVEQDRGVLEDVHLAPVSTRDLSAGSAAEPRAADEVEARFKLTALELSPQAKLVIERTLAASAGGTANVAPGSPPALQVPPPSPSVSRAGRDPFAFLTPPAPPRPPVGQAGPEAPLPEISLKGIVSFPDGFLAIVNNQIVKVGDTVSGHRVERITENSVTLTVPGGSPRTIELPELAPAPTAAPRR